MKTDRRLRITIIAILCRSELGWINAPVFFEQAAEGTAVFKTQFSGHIRYAVAWLAEHPFCLFNSQLLQVLVGRYAIELPEQAEKMKLRQAGCCSNGFQVGLI